MIPMLNRLKQLLAPLRYWNELPLRPLGDRPATTSAPASKIPPIVIQTWEDRLFGKNHLREMEKFRDLNPELSFEIWDRAQREGYLQDKWGRHPIFEIYQRSLFGPMKADIFRYCLMADRGGLYFDISKGCTVPLRTLYAPETEALITFEPHTSPAPCPPAVAPHLKHPDKLALQWGFGFAPGHPIPLQTIANICAEYPRYQARSSSSRKTPSANSPGRSCSQRACMTPMHAAPCRTSSKPVSTSMATACSRSRAQRYAT